MIMSNKYMKLYSVTDSPLLLEESVPFPVVTGAGQQIYTNTLADSADSTLMQFSVNITSGSILDRNLLVGSTVQWQMTISNVPIGEEAISLGYSSSLASMPLNSLFSTVTTTINSMPFPTQTNQIKSMLERMVDSYAWQKTVDTSAAQNDGCYYNFSDGVTSNSNPLASYNNTSYDQLSGRGATPVYITNVVHNISGDGTDSSLVSTSTGDTFVIQLNTYVIEPLMSAPWRYCASDKYSNEGIRGISQAFNIQMVIDSTMRRFFSSATLQTTESGSPYYTIMAPGLNGNGQLFVSPKVYTRTLTPRPTQKYPAKNSIKQLDYQYNAAGQAVITVDPNTTGNQISSNSVTYTQVPEFIAVCVRKQFNQQTIADSSSFMPITNCSIVFGEKSTLLSDMTQVQLHKLSMDNGSSLNWLQWSGKLYDNNSGGSSPVLPSTGSLLVLRPGKDFSLPEGYSSGSKGSFVFQITLTFNNATSQTIPVELAILCANSQIVTFGDGTCEKSAPFLDSAEVIRTQMESTSSLQKDKGLLVGGKRKMRHMSGGNVQYLGGCSEASDLAGLYD